MKHRASRLAGWIRRSWLGLAVAFTTGYGAALAAHTPLAVLILAAAATGLVLLVAAVGGTQGYLVADHAKRTEQINREIAAARRRKELTR